MTEKNYDKIPSVFYAVTIIAAWKGMMTLSPHITMALLRPMCRDTGAIIFPLLGQDVFMGKHSLQLHQHVVTSPCLNSIGYVA